MARLSEEKMMNISGKRFWAVALLLAMLPAGWHGLAQAASSKKHKVLIYPTADDTVDQLKQSGISKVENYGSYWLVEADDNELKALKARHGDRAVKANYLNHIELNVAGVDSSAGEPAIPENLREREPGEKRMRLVHFKGPVRPEWME